MDERLTDDEIEEIAVDYAMVSRTPIMGGGNVYHAVRMKRDDVIEFARAILARAAVPVVQPQEPVAWMAEDNTGYRGLTFIAPQTAEGAWDGFTITPLYAAPLARQEPTGWEKCAEPGSWHCGSGVMGMTKDYAYRKFDSGWHRLALPPAVAASGVTLKIALPPPANRSGAKTVEAPLGGPTINWPSGVVLPEAPGSETRNKGGQ